MQFYSNYKLTDYQWHQQYQLSVIQLSICTNKKKNKILHNTWSLQAECTVSTSQHTTRTTKYKAALVNHAGRLVWKVGCWGVGSKNGLLEAAGRGAGGSVTSVTCTTSRQQTRTSINCSQSIMRLSNLHQKCSQERNAVQCSLTGVKLSLTSVKQASSERHRRRGRRRRFIQRSVVCELIHFWGALNRQS